MKVSKGMLCLGPPFLPASYSMSAASLIMERADSVLLTGRLFF